MLATQDPALWASLITIAGVTAVNGAVFVALGLRLAAER